jgi:pyruvate dehydrogenase E2 component (dihydrolipoamide acetyltransferase)
VIFEVTMPVLGLTMEQGAIVAWLKEVGDQVEAGEPLFMVETDKATSDAPAPASGTLARIVSAEGDTVAVGAVIAYLAETADDLEQVRAAGNAAPAGTPGATRNAGRPGVAQAAVPLGTPAGPQGIPAAPAAPALPVVAPAPGRVLASPRARARALELGIELDAAAPSAGRLTEQDVLAMAAAPTAATAAPPPPSSRAAAPQPPTPVAPAADPQIKPLSRTRRIIAERMTFSATTIPQVTYTLRCDVTEALALRRSLKSGPGGERTAVSLDALLVRAAALALADFPEVNSQWAEGQGVRHLAEVNIAVAVDLDDRGLVIPVIHGADRLDIRAIAAELDRLVAGARAGKLGPDDYAGGTFTVTSLASLGVESFNPIIVPPQAAILGVGAIVPTPVFQQDQVVKRRLLALSLTTDHRILDGGPSARFLSRVRDLLEQPAKLA